VRIIIDIAQTPRQLNSGGRRKSGEHQFTPERIEIVMPKVAAADFARRRVLAAEQARDAGLHALLVTPGPDLAYFTGYTPTAVTERITLLVLPAEGDPALVVPLLERGDALQGPGVTGLRVHGWADGEDEYSVAARFLRPDGKYAVSDSAWAMHVLGLMRILPRSSYQAFTDVLPMLRAVKDPTEVDRLAAAGAAADAAFGDILSVRFAGRTESAIAADLDCFLRRHGHEQVDFTLVCAGENGADPHHDASDRVITEGEMVVMDFGGLMDGYGSDTTRTVHVGPTMTEEERRVHRIVQEAQQAGFEAVRPGAACQDVDRAARKVITDAGYGEFFIHRTGHGIGMTTHEPPYMVEGEQRAIQPGMCFSIEPGIYLPGKFGVRIEDIVVATDSGGRRLNNTSRDLQIVQ
jgi:Xaa-Pro aminopeptidase